MILEQLLVSPPSTAAMVVNLRKPGPTPVYRIGDMWSLNLYDQEGTVRFPGLGRKSHLHPGTICLMPPGLRRSFCFGTKGLQRVAHFRITPPVDSPQPVPSILQSPPGERRLLQLFDEALSHFPSQPRRADALLWNILWRIADLSQADAADRRQSGLPPTLKTAVTYIEQRLAEPLSVQAVVEHAGLSHTHLARLFHQHCGTSIVGYLKARRMALAEHLLLETDMPIKEIAWETGIADLQFFNKTVRKRFGLSPRRLRQAQGKGRGTP